MQQTNFCCLSLVWQTNTGGLKYQLSFPHQRGQPTITLFMPQSRSLESLPISTTHFTKFPTSLTLPWSLVPMPALI